MFVFQDSPQVVMPVLPTNTSLPAMSLEEQVSALSSRILANSGKNPDIRMLLGIIGKKKIQLQSIAGYVAKGTQFSLAGLSAAESKSAQKAFIAISNLAKESPAIAEVSFTFGEEAKDKIKLSISPEIRKIPRAPAMRSVPAKAPLTPEEKALAGIRKATQGYQEPATHVAAFDALVLPLETFVELALKGEQFRLVGLSQSQASIVFLALPHLEEGIRNSDPSLKGFTISASKDFAKDGKAIATFMPNLPEGKK